MFPLHTGHELVFSSNNNNNNIPQDLIPQPDHTSLHSSNITQHNNNICISPKLQQPRSMETNEITSTTNKKSIHRDIERQRRQEMSTLHASLRSLLPLEFIKGKRSISDQMNEAVNYIKHMERKVKQLSEKRDDLKTKGVVLKRPHSLVHEHDTSADFNVVVRPCLIGIEIVYSCGYRDRELLPLSRVLKTLLDEGLCVVNCVSTRVNEQLLHTIQTQVVDPSCFNLQALQQKLFQVK